MDLSSYSISELVQLYSQTLKELKQRGVLRTKNVIGELGEHLVLEHYLKSNQLPNLTAVPVGTQNINALSQTGERYSIKSTSGNVTGVFYGLDGPENAVPPKALFEYVVICKFDDDYSLEAIYQLTWDDFLKHKKWHSRMKAWNLPVNQAVKNDAVVVYDRNTPSVQEIEAPPTEVIVEESIGKVGYWEAAGKPNHSAIRDTVSEKIGRRFNIALTKQSQSRYISSDNEFCLFILSASYSNKNQEYWYSINDEIIPWLDDYPKCYIAFAMGSEKHVLLFSRDEVKQVLLPHCLRTKEDESKKKKAHYHFSFAVEGESHVYFKAKVPDHAFINVTSNLI